MRRIFFLHQVPHALPGHGRGLGVLFFLLNAGRRSSLLSLDFTAHPLRYARGRRSEGRAGGLSAEVTDATSVRDILVSKRETGSAIKRTSQSGVRWRVVMWHLADSAPPCALSRSQRQPSPPTATCQPFWHVASLSASLPLSFPEERGERTA